MDQAVDKPAIGGAAAPLTESEKNAIIAGVLLSMLLAALDQTIVAPAMPTIGRALGHAEYLPWIVTGYLLTATAMAPLYGKISDVYGRRPTVYAAILIFLAGIAGQRHGAQHARAGRRAGRSRAPAAAGCSPWRRPSSAIWCRRANGRATPPGFRAHGPSPASPGRCSAASLPNICTGR